MKVSTKTTGKFKATDVVRIVTEDKTVFTITQGTKENDLQIRKMGGRLSDAITIIPVVTNVIELN